MNEEKDLLAELAADADENFSLEKFAAELPEPVVEISLEELAGGIPPQQ